MKSSGTPGAMDAMLRAAATTTQQYKPHDPFGGISPASWADGDRRLVLRLANGSGKSMQMANFTSALRLLKAWQQSPSQQKSVRADIRGWLKQGRALTGGVRLHHEDTYLPIRYNDWHVPQPKAFALPRAFVLDGPGAMAPQLLVQDEFHLAVATGSGKTLALLGLLSQGRGRAAQQDEGLVLDASQLNSSLALFRSVDGLWAQLEASARLPDAVGALPPSLPLPDPLSIACGVRRLTVPLIPRAPGTTPPGLGMAARDDCSLVAPTGGVRAA